MVDLCIQGQAADLEKVRPHRRQFTSEVVPAAKQQVDITTGRSMISSILGGDRFANKNEDDHIALEIGRSLAKSGLSPDQIKRRGWTEIPPHMQQGFKFQEQDNTPTSHRPVRRQQKDIEASIEKDEASKLKGLKKADELQLQRKSRVGGRVGVKNVKHMMQAAARDRRKKEIKRLQMLIAKQKRGGLVTEEMLAAARAAVADEGNVSAPAAVDIPTPPAAKSDAAKARPSAITRKLQQLRMQSQQAKQEAAAPAVLGESLPEAALPSPPSVVRSRVSRTATSAAAAPSQGLTLEALLEEARNRPSSRAGGKAPVTEPAFHSDPVAMARSEPVDMDISPGPLQRPSSAHITSLHRTEGQRQRASKGISAVFGHIPSHIPVPSSPAPAPPSPSPVADDTLNNSANRVWNTRHQPKPLYALGGGVAAAMGFYGSLGAHPSDHDDLMIQGSSSALPPRPQTSLSSARAPPVAPSSTANRDGGEQITPSRPSLPPRPQSAPLSGRGSVVPLRPSSAAGSRAELDEEALIGHAVASKSSKVRSLMAALEQARNELSVLESSGLDKSSMALDLSKLDTTKDAEDDFVIGLDTSAGIDGDEDDELHAVIKSNRKLRPASAGTRPPLVPGVAQRQRPQTAKPSPAKSPTRSKSPTKMTIQGTFSSYPEHIPDPYMDDPMKILNKPRFAQSAAIKGRPVFSVGAKKAAGVVGM